MEHDFEVVEPETLEAALELLSADDETVRAVGGGTGLALMMRYGFFRPTRLVSLRRLPSRLASVRVDEDGSLRMGALATLRDLQDSGVVAARAPVLAETMPGLASVRLRNIATLGGALAHGHPQMDLPPVLIALDARVRVRSRSGERWLPVEELCLGYYETALAGDELITEVVVPPAEGLRAAYEKVTARTADDWPMLGVAVGCTTADGVVDGARVAVAAVTDRAERLPQAEAVLVGNPPTDEWIRRAAEAAAEEVACHDGPDGSADYQRQLLRVHVRRALARAVAPAGDGQRR